MEAHQRARPQERRTFEGHGIPPVAFVLSCHRFLALLHSCALYFFTATTVRYSSTNPFVIVNRTRCASTDGCRAYHAARLCRRSRLRAPANTSPSVKRWVCSSARSSTKPCDFSRFRNDSLLKFHK